MADLRTHAAFLATHLAPTFACFLDSHATFPSSNEPGPTATPLTLTSGVDKLTAQKA
jgi:hypothetical protein